MPPDRRPRYDGYAEPVPPLTAAEHESLRQRVTNQEAIARIQAILETRYQESLRRGQYLEVIVVFVIQDGVIQQEVTETLIKTYR